MYLFFEEAGDFKAGTVLKKDGTNYQVELTTGRRCKVKANHVFFEFESPAAATFLTQAQEASSEIDEADELVCIECPRGCRLRIGRFENGSVAVEGNGCPKGKRYGEEEMKNPRRVLTTSVKTVFGGQPRLSVRTDGGIPVSALTDAMKAAAKLTVSRETVPGDTIVKNFGGWGVDLIATSECRPESRRKI